jgi:hypothetical protein
MPPFLQFLASNDPEGRLHPEEFLEIAKEEERKKKRGRLTVYLGYAAGVGKTYAMLSSGAPKGIMWLSAISKPTGGPRPMPLPTVSMRFQPSVSRISAWFSKNLTSIPSSP